MDSDGYMSPEDRERLKTALASITVAAEDLSTAVKRIGEEFGPRLAKAFGDLYAQLLAARGGRDV